MGRGWRHEIRRFLRICSGLLREVASTKAVQIKQEALKRVPMDNIGSARICPRHAV